MVSVFNSSDQLQASKSSGYYARVQSLMYIIIERMYKDGGNAKVTIVVHSLGVQSLSTS